MVEPINIEDAMEHVEQLLETQDIQGAGEFLRELHPVDSAEILVELEPKTQAALTAQLQPEELADLFEQMDEDEVVDVAQHLPMQTLVTVLDAMEPDEAADLLGEMEDEDAQHLLQEMEEGPEIQQLLTYDPETAGGIMNAAPPCLRRQMTVTDAFRYIKRHFHDENELFYLYVLDRYGRLIGVVNLRALLLAETDQTVEEIMNRDVLSVNGNMDQEEVSQVLARYDLLALPVTDDQNRLVGIISVDDVVDVLEEEATEDIYRLAQVGEKSDIFSPMGRAIRSRLPWLYINLGTALLAASVVALFEDTIERVAVLAAFMPIVAGQGGNAGNQTMTLVVRSLALGEMSLRDVWVALRHEILLGLLHGLVLGVSIALLGWLWKGNAMLGLVTGLAMLSNFIVAAMAGVLVPAVFERFKIDPALASGVFVTTATDVAGFAVFLGLATYFLAWLV